MSTPSKYRSTTDPLDTSGVDTSLDTSQPASATPPALEENEEAIEDVAGMLVGCDSFEVLQELKKVFTPSLLMKASKRLAASQAHKILEWLDLLRSDNRRIHEQW